MKRLLLIVLSFFFLSTFCWADSVTLEWDVSESQIDGYYLYRANRIGDHTTAWVKIATIAKDIAMYVDEIDGENYAWLITAFDNEGNESFPSNMVERYDRTPPMTIQNLRK